MEPKRVTHRQKHLRAGQLRRLTLRQLLKPKKRERAARLDKLRLEVHSTWNSILLKWTSWSLLTSSPARDLSCYVF
ncbi:hypothetical protein WJX84_004292 [Apatococcus fuscideae]|uniref:Uncharacterized protein n=1 Tax=Apatococcus fuscideae TaxID=2026836 RepID=A0AAW1SPC0_9CHLO